MIENIRSTNLRFNLEKDTPETSMAVSSDYGQATIQILQQCDCRSSGGNILTAIIAVRMILTLKPENEKSDL